VNYPLVSPKTSTTGFVSPFTATTCAEVPDSNENKITATYKLKASEDLNFNAGVGYANRVAEINPLFYNPMQTTGASGGAYGAGYEFQQFMSYMDASRRQDILKLGANWQANDKFSFGFKGNYNLDSYGSEYGVQNGRSYSLNLDATYAATEHSSFSAYATSQNKTRDMTSLQALAAANENTTTGVATSATKLSSPANATWSNTLTEKDLTIGVGAKQGGFMDNKLDLTGDLTYSLDKTSYDTELGYAGVTTGGLTCSSAQFMTCGALPDIKSDMLQLKLAGTYRIDNVSKVRVGYLFQRLNATDFMYNTYQYGSAPANMMPTNQQAPSYSVNVVSVSYALNF
jgi:MtrB/PioB family decaheme-associated outer membrane protein